MLHANYCYYKSRLQVFFWKVCYKVIIIIIISRFLFIAVNHNNKNNSAFSSNFKDSTRLGMLHNYYYF